MGLGQARPLTAMALRVLRVSAMGLKADEVAEHLDLDPAEVRQYLREVTFALGARSKLEAIVLAGRSRPIDLPGA